MKIRYSANALNGSLQLPSFYVDLCTVEELAELAAIGHWQDHPEETPTQITVVHLLDVDGQDLGVFEVRCEQRPVFTASHMRQA